MDTFNFIGFNGKTYSFSNLPTDISSLNHYVIIDYNSIYTYIIPFNDNIHIFNNDGYLCVEIDNFIPFTYYRQTKGSSNWEYFNRSSLSCGSKSSSSVIYSCDDLKEYSFELNTLDNFYWEEPQNFELFNLKSIVEDVDSDINIISSTFNNIFDILPVFIVFLISFIGVKKGISYLFSFLHRS